MMVKSIQNGLGLMTGVGGAYFWPRKKQEKDIIAFVEKCAKVGITRLYPSWYSPDTVFRLIGDYTDWKQGPVTGKLKDLHGDWDPWQVLIDAARYYGLKVYPYVAVNAEGEEFSCWHAKLGDSLPVIQITEFADKHPEFWRKTLHGKNAFEVAPRLKLSPAFPEVSEYLRKSYLEPILKYDVDGIQLEFLLDPVDDEFNNSLFGYEKPIVDAFYNKMGKNAYDVGNGDEEWLKFRAEYQTQFIRDLRKDMKNLPNNPELSIVIFAGDPSNGLKHLQDWPGWVNEGLVDALHVWHRDETEAIYDYSRKAAEICKGKTKFVVQVTPWAPEDGKRLFSPGLLRYGIQRGMEAGAEEICLYRADAVEYNNLWDEISRVKDYVVR